MVGSEDDDERQNGDERQDDNGRQEHDGRQLPERLFTDLILDPKSSATTVASAAVRAWGFDALAFAARVQAEHPEATSRDLAKMVKARHATLARMGGAAAALPSSLVTTNTAAAVAPPALVGLWIRSRMVVHIAAVYGRDTTKPEMVAELLALQGFYAVAEPAARVVASDRSMRWATRVVNAHLKGDTLKKAKKDFDRVHVKFSRAGVLRALPYLAVPVSAVVNEATTRSLANRVIEFYDPTPRRAS